MAKKPSYEELEQRVVFLESELSAYRTGMLEDLKRSVDRSLDVIYRYDIPAGRYVYFNKAGFELYGLTAGQTPSARSVMLSIHPEDRARVRKAAIDCLKPGCDRGTVEYRQRHADGSIRWRHDKWAVIRDASGEPIAIEGIVRDETHRKLTEQELRESEERFRRVANATSDIVYELRVKDEMFSYVSPTCEAILGYTAEEIMNKPYIVRNKLIPNEDLEKVKKKIVKAFKGSDDKMTLELRMRCKDGSVKYLFENATLIRGQDNRVEKTIGSFKDITELKILEDHLRQTRKIEAIGTLAGGIAHEFNNILGIIIGNVELALSDVPVRHPVYDFLMEVQRASFRARDVVQQLLRFSRKSEHRQKAMNIIPVVKESLQFLRSSIPAAIEFRIHIPDECATILADATEISQIMINLCTNAVHAIEEDGIVSVDLENVALSAGEVSFDPDLKAGKYVRLTVSDTGCGIPPSDIEKIFDPYFTTKDIDQGIGMGLAVVHGIIKSHNGSIQVKSKPGKGTTFTILFPATDGQTETEAQVADDLPKGNERILLIDDEASLVKTGRQLLEKFGYLVETKTDPVEALEFFRSNPDPFDLIITDMTMPGLRGDQLVKEMLKIRYDVPIILCTGYNERINVEKASELGIAQYVMKPIDSRHFAITVRRVLDKNING